MTTTNPTGYTTPVAPTTPAARPIPGNSESCFTNGLDALYMLMELQNFMANAKYDAMKKNSESSRTAQENANIMDTAIADTNKAKNPATATKEVNKQVIKYLQDNGIIINGQSPVDFFKDATGISDPDKCFDGKMDKGHLMAIKSALETKANRASDFVSQSQLQLQKIMQTYNVTTSLINSLQVMLADINKTIAQGIR